MCNGNRSEDFVAGVDEGVECANRWWVEKLIELKGG